MLLENLNIDQDRLAHVCKRYGAARLEVFGSFFAPRPVNQRVSSFPG